MNSNLELTTAAGGYGKRWIRSAVANYAYANNNQTFQATLTGFTNPIVNALFSLNVISTTDATTAELTSIDPVYASPNLVQVCLQAQSSTTCSLYIEGKDLGTGLSSANPTNLKPVATGLAMPSTSAPLTIGLSITDDGTGNNTLVTVYYGTSPSTTKTATILLPSGYSGLFNTGAYLYVEAGAGSTSPACTFTATSIGVTGFVDSFSGGSLSSVNWQSATYSGSGPGGGNGGTTGVSGSPGALTLTTGAAANDKRWIASAGSDYSYINSTLSVQTVVKNWASNTSSTSGFDIYLVGKDSSTTTAELEAADPLWSCPNVIDLRFDADSNGVGQVSIRGKYGASGQDPGYNGNSVPTIVTNFPIYELGVTSSLAIQNGSMVGFAITNNGVGSASTITIYSGPGTSNYGPVRQNFTLPAAFNTYFSGPVYVYVMSNTGTTTANASSFSNVTVTSQPVQVATIAVANTTTKQTIAGYGGDYAKDRSGGESTDDDASGTNNLSGLKPTYARIGIPLAEWEPSNQNLSSSSFPSVIQAGHYFAGQDTGNMHTIFQLIQQLQAGGVTHFIFSIWQMPSWMEGSPPVTDGIPNTTAGRAAFVHALAAFLLYAHANYSLDLTKVYLSYNEPDISMISASEYALIIYNAGGLFSGDGITNTVPWMVGDTASIYGWLAGPPQNWQVGSVMWNGYSGSYTDQVITSLTSDQGSSPTSSQIVISAHSWDELLSPTYLNFLSQMGTHYSLPVWCPEVGYNYGECYDSDQNSTSFETSWDNAWKDINVYQKVLNFGGVSVALWWEYMEDTGLRDSSGNALQSYYPIYRLLQNFPVGTTILGTTTTGYVEGMAGGSSGSVKCVQVIQNDDRPMNVSLTGLVANHTYTIHQSCNGVADSTTLGSITSVTADANGNVMLPVPSAPIETVTITTGGTLMDSGRAISLTY